MRKTIVLACAATIFVVGVIAIAIRSSADMEAEAARRALLAHSMPDAPKVDQPSH